MPIWKVSQAEETAALVAQGGAQGAARVWWHERSDAVTKPCEHEAQIAPHPEQRALERLRVDPALRPVPGATIAKIKARVIPRERHNIDNDLEAPADPVGGSGVLEHVVGRFSFPVSSRPFAEAAGTPVVQPAVTATVAAAADNDGEGEDVQMAAAARLARETQLAQTALLEQEARSHAQQLAQPFLPAALAPAASASASDDVSSVGSASSKRKTGPDCLAQGLSRGSSTCGEFSAARSGSDDSASVRSASGDTVAAAAAAGQGAPVKKARNDTAASLETLSIDGTPIKRRRTKIPLSSVEILQDWFSAHVSNPYPSEDEKAALMAKAKLDAVQLINWFTNTRKRFWFQHPTDRNQNKLCTTRVIKGATGPPDESGPATSGANAKAAGTNSATGGSLSSSKRAQSKSKKRPSVKEEDQDEDDEEEEEEDQE